MPGIGPDLSRALRGAGARVLSSGRRLRSTRDLSVAGMLLAVQVILGQIAAIPIGPTIRVSFGYLALSMAGALLGPVPAAVNGALADVVGFLIRPTGPYFPGFTVTGLVSGMIYGLALYERPMTVWRVLLTKLVIDLVCNLLLNTLWLNMLYGKAFFVLLPGRALKNLIQYPVDAALLYPFLSRVVPAIGKRAHLERPKVPHS